MKAACVIGRLNAREARHLVIYNGRAGTVILKKRPVSVLLIEDNDLHAELVQLEIDRLENKIRSLSELAVNRQEPEFISDQVDSVAHSMLDTERTMNDLQFATGLIEMNEDAPRLINRAKLKTQ